MFQKFFKFSIVCRARKSARAFAMWCGIVFVCLNAAAAVPSTGRRDASFPISLRSDRQSFVSSIYIKCNYSPHAVAASAFRTAPPDSPEQAFFQILAALNKGDVNECKKLTTAGSTAGLKDLASVIKAYQNSFDLHPEHLKTMGHLEVGTNVLFLWETVPLGGIAPSDHQARNLFTFEDSTSGGFYWADGRNNIIATMIRGSLQVSVNETNFERVISVRHSQFEFPIPATTNGVAAALQFNGRVYGVPLKGDKVDKDDILNFYRNAFQLFEEGNIVAFAKNYTPESQKKLLDWFATKSPDEVSAFSRDTIETRRFVSFIIDADPFFIVFTRSSMDLTTSEMHRHDYVLRDPSDGKFRLTSFYFQSFFDDFLNNPDNFERPFLIPKLEAAQHKPVEKRGEPQSKP